MVHRRWLIATVLLAWLAAPTSWSLAATRSAAPPAADEPLVDAAARYLDGLTTAQGRFVQEDSAGHQASGTFWLQRPGRARFDYDPPSGLAMASDGTLVSVVNHQLKTIQSYPLSFTPLALFLARDIRLGRGGFVRQVRSRSADFDIELAKPKGASKERIDLTFSRAPLALTGWTLTDARGQTVKVRLTSLQRSAPRPKAFFNIYDPSLHGSRPAGSVPLD